MFAENRRNFQEKFRTNLFPCQFGDDVLLLFTLAPTGNAPNHENLASKYWIYADPPIWKLFVYLSSLAPPSFKGNGAFGEGVCWIKEMKQEWKRLPQPSLEDCALTSLGGGNRSRHTEFVFSLAHLARDSPGALFVSGEAECRISGFCKFGQNSSVKASISRI